MGKQPRIECTYSLLALQIPKQKRASGITEFGYECLEVAAVEEREITRRCFFFRNRKSRSTKETADKNLIT